MTETLRATQPTDGVLWLTIDRVAARNALDAATLYALRDAVVSPAEDVRCIVVTGTGTRAFSAGYDVKELAGLSHDAQLRDYLTRDNWLSDMPPAPCRRSPA